MTITLLYFAAVRDLVARDEEKISLPSDVRTVRDLSAFLARHHAALDGRLQSVRFARNETFVVTNDEALADGDVVALIPPVAGG